MKFRITRLPPALILRNLPAMNLMKERSCGELALFAAAVFGIWLSIWGVIFVSAAIEATAVSITLVVLIIFALRGSD